MQEEKEKLYKIALVIQVVFLVLAVLALAFAQAINATLSMMTVLAAFGGAVAVEIVVVAAIWAYLHFYGGTLGQVSTGVRYAGTEIAKKAKIAVDAVSENVAKSSDTKPEALLEDEQPASVAHKRLDNDSNR